MKVSSRLSLGAVALAAALGASAAASAKTAIDFYFPVPVQGALSREMARIVKEFNDKSADVEVTAAYTGSYDDTRLKSQAAIDAGKPPAVTLMSANFVQEFVISGEIEAIDDLLAENGGDPKTFLDDFWPALRGNAVANGKIYAIPFQNSTPLVYINVDQFKEAGLDPAKPPATWVEFIAAARKLAKHEGDKTTRYAFEMPSTYDYCGWLTQA
ncbi:MAG: extracellular solute-binding protein, partial [Roseiarcus sp.]